MEKIVNDSLRMVGMMCVLSLLSGCNVWWFDQTPELKHYQVEINQHSLSIDFNWQIENQQQTDLRCLFRPDPDTKPIAIENCGRINQGYYAWSSAGAYLTSFELYGDDGRLLDKQEISIELKPMQVSTLTIHYLPNQLFAGIEPLLTARGEALSGQSSQPIQFNTSDDDDSLHAVLAVADGDQLLEFRILNRDDNQQILFQGRLTPNQFGDQLWVTPSLPTTANGYPALFHKRRHVALAMAALARTVAEPDLSPVVVVDRPALDADWMDSANFMEIYVRAYQDSNDDGIGDFQGLISRLPYLQKLGITALWLMPIHHSSDNDHGYAVVNYRDVEPDYGTLADFQQLLDQAHQRGIAIIIDYLINHSSNVNPLFLDANSDIESPYRDWYVWRDEKPDGWSIFDYDPWRSGRHGWYYAPFSEIMPEFNFQNPKVMEFHLNNLRFWLNLGVDGFRFDAVGLLTENGADAWEDQPENHVILKRLRESVEQYRARYVVCESSNGFSAYANPDSCGRAFNFSAHSAIIQSIRQGKVNADLMEELRAPYVDQTPFLLANHDSFAGERVWDQLGGDLALYRLAAQTYLLTSRHPFTYYGEEIGMSGGSDLTGDHALRVPMSWQADPNNAGFSKVTPFRNLAANVLNQNVAAAINQPDSLYHHYRQLYQLRNNHPIIARGQLKVESQMGDDYLLIHRSDGYHHAVIAINYSDQQQTLAVQTGLGEVAFLSEYGTHQDVTSDSLGALTVSLPAREAVVLIGQIGASPEPAQP